MSTEIELWAVEDTLRPCEPWVRKIVGLDHVRTIRPDPGCRELRRILLGRRHQDRRRVAFLERGADEAGLRRCRTRWRAPTRHLRLGAGAVLGEGQEDRSQADQRQG